METKIKEAAEKWFYEQDQSTERSYTKYDVFEAGYLAAHSQHSESLNKLKEQLEKWISDCEIQAERFVKDNHEVSYLSSKAMAQAYRNALELINPNP